MYALGLILGRTSKEWQYEIDDLLMYFLTSPFQNFVLPVDAHACIRHCRSHARSGLPPS